MRDKLIVEDNDIRFELDLSQIKISYQEENPRFKDTLTTKFSFPFEFHLDRDLRILMGDFSSINASSLKTLYPKCFHISDGVIREAKLEILGATGEVIRAQIDSGFEQFPNWDKKLRDLPLGTVTSDTESMISVANTTIFQSYPSVNYNFPMIHSDIYKDIAPFIDFEKIINKRVNGEFILNSANPSMNEYNNNNIVIPIPYWLHILKTGFEDAGFELHGDILDNPYIKSAMPSPTRIKLFENRESVEWIVGVESINDDINLPILFTDFYVSEQPIRLNGQFRYNITLSLGLTSIIVNDNNNEYAPQIWFNGERIHYWTHEVNYQGSFILNTVPGEENILRFSGIANSNQQEVLHVEIIPLVLYDEEGNYLNPKADFTSFNLASQLPDITFGDFITITKNIFNFDYDIIGDREVHMNHIENAFASNEMVDVRAHEVKHPERTFEQAKSFLLSYADVDHEEYILPKLYYDSLGVQSESYTATDDTHKIDINAIPLPIKTENGISTAHQYFDDESIVQIIRYNGLREGKNECQDISPFNLLNIFNKYWSKWLYFRVHAQHIKWRFFVNKNRWRGIRIFTQLYAYHQKIWIRKINKTNLDENTYEIELECDIVKN